MAGQNFTIATSFGIGNGPTYSGQTVVAPPVTGNNPVLLDQVIAAAGSPQTVYTEGFLEAACNGYGFQATLLDLNSNPATPSITVNINGAAGLIKAYTLTNGQSVALADAFDLASTDVTDITVTPDATSEFELFGIINLDI